MALRTIRIQGDEVLNKRCREVTEMTPRIATLIEDMIETMDHANGVGLAACQEADPLCKLCDNRNQCTDYGHNQDNF